MPNHLRNRINIASNKYLTKNIRYKEIKSLDLNDFKQNIF